MIKIGSFRFRVKEVVDLRDGEQKLDGEIRYNEKIIRIEKNNNQQIKDMTVLHEAIHGMLTFGINRELGADEALVSLVAYNLYNFVRDNKKLMRDIAERK